MSVLRHLGPSYPVMQTVIQNAQYFEAQHFGAMNIVAIRRHCVIESQESFWILLSGQRLRESANESGIGTKGPTHTFVFTEGQVSNLPSVCCLKEVDYRTRVYEVEKENE